MYDFMDGYARYSYEQLQLQQPHLKTDGIYKEGLEYFIKCESLNIKPLNQPDSSIVEVFNKKIKILGCKITLVTKLPDGVSKLENRTLEEVIHLSGNPFNIIDFNKHLSLLLPKAFPKLWLNFNHNSQRWDVEVEKSLTQSEIDILQNKVSLLCGYEAKIDCKLTPDITKNFERKNQDPLSITVSKHSSFNYSKALMDKWEEDEQLWLDNRRGLFLGDQSINSENDKQQGSTCLINGQFGEAHNVRNYLTLFNEIKIVVPIEPSYEKFLHSLDITEDELVKLTELNKVKLVFPHSIERYNRKLLEKVSNINPKSIMLSRELAYRTVQDLKQRNPLVFLPLNTDEQQEVLSNLIGISSKLKGTNEQKWFEGLAGELSNTWGHMYEFLSNRGAMGTFNVGLGPIINTTIKNYTGKDYFLEIMGASQSIEWAAANHAVLCPVGPLARNEENIAYLYSGVRKDWELDLVTSPNVATEGILTIANYVPVLELAETFTGKEIDQFRKLLVDLTHNKSTKEISSIVEQFNKSVKAFEKKRNRIDTWDVKGITLDTALEITNAAIPFSGFIAKQVGRLIEYTGDKNESVSKVIKQVQSKIHRTSPNVVLVSRMREKVKDLL